MLLPSLSSRLAQLLPHVARKNSVLVLQTKGLNFAKDLNLTQTRVDLFKTYLPVISVDTLHEAGDEV